MNQKQSTEKERTRTYGIIIWKPTCIEGALSLEEIEDHRYFDCTNYDQCLDLAVESRWANFTCQDCPVWKYDRENKPPASH